MRDEYFTGPKGYIRINNGRFEAVKGGYHEFYKESGLYVDLIGATGYAAGVRDYEKKIVPCVSHLNSELDMGHIFLLYDILTKIILIVDEDAKVELEASEEYLLKEYREPNTRRNVG